MAQLAISLFGSFHVTLDGRPVTAFQSDKVRGLLAFLAVEAAAPQRRERLAGLLWPDSPEAQARHSLSQALLNLRRATSDHLASPPFFLITRKAVQLNPASDHWSDVAALTQLLSSPAGPLLEDAVALYRGPFLAGFSLPDSVLFEEWALLERERLHRLALEALGRLAHLEEQAGALNQALLHTQRLLALDPLAEEAHRRAMRLLHRLGRRGEALAQYETCRRLLAEELDAQPAPPTAELARQIKGSRSANENSDFSEEIGVLRAATLHNLPAPATAFVGRDQELAVIQRWLADESCRLLTLTGMGGIGKTRLALHAASAATHAGGPFPDGVWLASLATVDAADEVPAAILAALGVRLNPRRGDARQQLRRVLRARRLLLLLDNAEHLVDNGLPALLADLLAAAPAVKLLVTSRLRLGLQGEQTLALHGMITPPYGALDPDQARHFSALALFEQRARLAQPGFVLDSSSLPDAAALCRQVEGYPLAIELAAAWLEALPLAQICAELEHSLDFLHADLADLPERHRSLWAVCHSMWRLLTPAEQAGLARLALFHGGFTFAAAQQVAGVTVDTLRGLLRKSLVQRQSNARYSLHQVVRQFARERLHADPPAAARAQDRYAVYFTAWLRQQGEHMAGPQQKDAFDAVAADFENCRVAWLLSVERGYYDLANQALEGLYGYNMARMTATTFGDLMRAGLERLPAGPPDREATLLRARLLAFQGCDMFWRAALEPERCRQALALVEAEGLHEQMGIAWPLLINQYAAAVDPERGLAMAQEMTRTLRRHSDLWILAVGLNLAAHTLWGCGLRSEARDTFLESAAISRQCGDRLLLARDLTAAARITFYQHRWDDAQGLYEESLALFRDLDAAPDAAVCLEALGELACAKGDYRMGLERFRQTGALLAEAGDVQPGYVPLQHWQSITLARVGELAEARRLREHMLHEELQGGRLLDAFYSAVELAEIWRIAGDLAEAQRAIGMGYDLLVGMELVDSWKPNAHGTYCRIAGEIALDQGDLAAAQAYFEQGLSWWQGPDVNWGTSYCATGLGRVAVALGELEQAAAHLHAGLLHGRRGFGDMNVLTRALAGIVDWLMARGEVEEALALAAQVAALPGAWETTRRSEALCRRLAAQLPAAVAASAQQRGQSADLDAAVDHWLAQLAASSP